MAKTAAQVKAALVARRDAVLDELAALDSTKAGGLPNASGEGLNVDHQGYRRSLYEELAMIDKQLSRSSPGVVISEGR